MDIQTIFEDHADKLLDLSLDEDPRKAGKDVLRDLQYAYLEATSDHKLVKPLRDKTTACGVAIRPDRALMCMEDFERSRIFARGLVEAIKEAQKRFPGQKIRVLYAGTGPVASMAAIASTAFGPDEVEFTLMDIHEYSVLTARRVFDILGFSDRLANNILSCDAAIYSNDGPLFHVVFSETMDPALMEESQAGIMANLGGSRILHPNGLFVPKAIMVRVSMETGKNKYDPIGNIVRVDRDFGAAARDPTGGINERRLKKVLRVDSTVPMPTIPSAHTMWIETVVECTENLVLQAGRSLANESINFRIEPHETPGTLEFKYTMGLSESIAIRIRNTRGKIIRRLEVFKPS